MDDSDSEEHLLPEILEFRLNHWDCPNDFCEHCHAKLVRESWKEAKNKERDLVVTCRDISWHIHKSVVCAQSDFFRAAFRGNFKEARENKIDLPDDDPAAVDRMLTFFYRRDFEFDLTPGESTLQDLSEVFVLAEKCGAPGLKKYTVERFQEEAQKHFDSWIKEYWSSPVEDGIFIEAVHHAYTSTLDSVRGMRDAVCKVIHRNIGYIPIKHMEELYDDHPDLCWDLVLTFHRQCENGLPSRYRR